VASIQPRAAAQPLDNALFDIYDDLEDDEQRIAEQKKRREEEEQKRREEQERLSNLHNNQAAYVPSSYNDHIR
jgi:septal ring factor EnvC (AmiA/AmiB activator)